MAVQRVLALHRGRARLGDVGPDVRAALLLGHAHPGQHAGLGRRHAQTGVVGRRGQERRPLLGERVVDPQRRHRGVRHRDRAPVSRLRVRPRHEAGGPTDVRVRVPVRLALPGGGAQPVADRPLQQPVPGRVEVHLVDPVAVAVVLAQLGVVLVGEPAVLAGLLGPRLRPRSPPGTRAPLAPACRTTASDSAASAVTTLCPASSGTWLAALRMSAGLWSTMRLPYDVWPTRRCCPPASFGPATSSGASSSPRRAAASATGSPGWPPRRRSSPCCPCRRWSSRSRERSAT